MALKKGKDYNYIRDVMSLKLKHLELSSSEEEAQSHRSAAMAAAMAKSLAGSKREASEVIFDESEQAEEASLKR